MPSDAPDPLALASALLTQAAAFPEGDPRRDALAAAARVLLAAPTEAAPAVPLRRVGP